MLGDAPAELTAVVEHLQAPVITTREGKGAIDDRNPLSVGTMWVNKRLAPIIADADVILAVGTQFQATGATKDQVVVHLDVDPTEIGRHFADAVPVVGDAVSTLAVLLTELQARSDPRPSRAAETRAMRERVEDELRAIGPAAGMVETLREAVPDDGARPVHDHHGLHVPHALPHLRAAHLPVDVVHGHARSAPPPRSVPRSHGPTYRWCASPATAGSSSRQPSCASRCSTASTP